MSKSTKRTDLIDGINSETIVNITGASYTVTKAQSGTTFTLSKSDGITVTMPDAGDGDIIGNTYTFLFLLTPTSAGYTITGATSDNLLQGKAVLVSTTLAKSDVFQPGASDYQVAAVTADLGWLEGSVVTLTCIAADQWFVDATMGGVGATMATPFA